MRWNDPKLAIAWPLDGIGESLVSGKDASESVLDEAEPPTAYSQ
jgi:dTDP-4-dehydrorhamnose 3,5-epimerase-like enzyme